MLHCGSEHRQYGSGGSRIIGGLRWRVIGVTALIIVEFMSGEHGVDTSSRSRHHTRHDQYMAPSAHRCSDHSDGGVPAGDPGAVGG